MWFKLAGATFSTHLGPMSKLSNSISIKYNASGFSYTTGSVSKDDASASLVLTLNNNWTYEHNNSNVTVTGATKGATSYSNGTLTIPITPSSGSTFGNSGVSSINVTVTGAVSSGGEPDTPVNPNPPSGDATTLSPYSVSSGFYIDSRTKFDADSASSVVVYSVQPNSTYTLSVEKKSGAASSNANLIFVPVKSLNGLQAGGAPDFATGYSARVVEMSTNETNVLNYQFTTPADCIYLLFSNYKSGSTHTVVGVSGAGNTPNTPEVEGTDVALTKTVDGVYLGPTAKYTADGTSQVLCYAVSPNKTYAIGAPLDLSKKLVVCCVKSIDNIVAGNTATFATGWSDRQIGEAGANLTVTTPADCTHLIFSNYLQNQAPTYVKLVN